MNENRFNAHCDNCYTYGQCTPPKESLVKTSSTLRQGKSAGKVFDWKEQLQVGDRGQELFAQYYPHPVTIFPEHKADFRRVTDGALVELKSDTYSLEKTDNFFFERWGDISRTKPGGPWRARRDRVSVFVYYYVRHNLMFEFESKSLCKVLDKLTKKLSPICIKSNGWAVLGFKVPILSVLAELVRAELSKARTSGPDMLGTMESGGAQYSVYGFKHADIDGEAEWQKFLSKDRKD